MSLQFHRSMAVEENNNLIVSSGRLRRASSVNEIQETVNAQVAGTGEPEAEVEEFVSGGVREARNRVFCFACQRDVAPAGYDDNGEPIPRCNECNSDFVEIYDNESPRSADDNPAHFVGIDRSQRNISDARTLLEHLLHLMAVPPPRRQMDTPSSPRSSRFSQLHNRQIFRQRTLAGREDPFHLLVQTLRSASASERTEGGDVDGEGGPQGIMIGDYFLGPGLQNLLARLSEENGPRGPPPAPKSAIDGLTRVTLLKAHTQPDCATCQCPVCQEKFEVGATALQMPCQHLFHDNCITTWLNMHNSCPVCREPLKPDQPDQENGSHPAC